MAEIGSWNGHSFTVSPTLIRSFTELTIKGSSETKDKTSKNQKYVSRKNSKPVEISLTAELNALTGCDVKNEALQFVDEARSGAKDYFYLNGKKLVACKLMLTEASVSETEIAPNGTWVRCKVKLAMKQCAKYDGTASSSSSGSSSSSKKTTSKTSVKKNSTTSTAKTNAQFYAEAKAEDIALKKSSTSSTAKTNAQVYAETKAEQKIQQVTSSVNSAKQTSSATKQTSTSTKVFGGQNRVKRTLK